MHDFLAANPDLLTKVHAVTLDLLQLVLLAVVSGLGWAVKLWINSMNSRWKQAIAFRLVSFAENRLPTDAAKFAYVSQQLSTILNGRITAQETDHLIEEAVVELRAKLGSKP